MAEPTTTWTFVFADLAGYTALTEAHGDERAERIASRFFELAASACAGDARIVKTLGDGVMLVARSVAEAVESVHRLAGLIALEPGFPAARIGIHEGSAILAHADYFGATVNVCSRLMEHARPGQIVCSERVAAQVAGQGAVWTHPLGLLRLKHLAQPVSAYELGFEGAHAPLQFIDPVCRMQVADDGYLERTYAGRTLRFCSTECERRFFEQRELYLDAPTPS